MLKRTWHVTTPTGERTLTLHRNRITGLHTLYADDEVIYMEEGRWKHHFYHKDTIDDVPYELSVTVDKGVFHAYLIMNGVCVPAEGEDDISPDCVTGQQMLKARSYCQELADVTGLKYYPHPGIPEWHRLVGVLDGYLVFMEYYNANEYQDIPYCSLQVRHQKTENTKAMQEALEGDVQLAAFQQKLELDDKLRVGHAQKMTGFRVPYNDDIHVLSERLRILIRIIKPYLQPISLGTCEQPKCKSDSSETLKLMIYNGIIPQVTCQVCALKHQIKVGLVKPEPRPDRDKHLLIVSILVCAVVLTVIYQFDPIDMIMIGSLFPFLIFGLVCELAHMEFSVRYVLFLYGMATCGFYGSIYLAVFVDMLISSQRILWRDLLNQLPSTVSMANSLAVGSLEFIGLYSTIFLLPVLGIELIRQKLPWLRSAVVSDPPVGVELVGDVPFTYNEEEEC